MFYLYWRDIIFFTLPLYFIIIKNHYMITIFTCKFIFLILHAFYSDETSTTNNISNNESWEISKLFIREVKYILICTLLFFFLKKLRITNFFTFSCEFRLKFLYHSFYHSNFTEIIRCDNKIELLITIIAKCVIFLHILRNVKC